MNMRDLIDRLDQLKEAADFAGGWPASKAEVQAFQTAQGITPVDGLIGKNTMAALTAAGAVPPAGFVPVGQKQSTQSKVKAANAAYAANQAKAPQGDQTAGGKTNAAFLPGAAGGAAPAATDSGANAATAMASKSAATEPGPQPNAFGVMPQANVPGMQTGTAPAATASAAPLGIQPQANVPGMQTGTAPAATAPAATAPAAGGATNPWAGTDPAKAAAWAALSPEDQKWIGKADPTDKIILARAPSKGGFVGSITPNFMKKKEPAATAPTAAPAPAPAAPAPGPALGTQPAMSESGDFQRMLDLAGIKPQANVAEHKKKDSEILTEAGLPPWARSAAAGASEYGGKAVNWLKNKISPEIHPPTGPIGSGVTPPAGANLSGPAGIKNLKLLQGIEELNAAKDARQFAAELTDLQKKALQAGIDEKSFWRTVFTKAVGSIASSKLVWLSAIVGYNYASRPNKQQGFAEWATEAGLDTGSALYNSVMNYVEKDDRIRSEAAELAKKNATVKEISDMLIQKYQYPSSKAERTAQEMVNAYGGKAGAASTAAPAATEPAATTDKAAAPAAAPAAKAPAASPAPAAAPAANSTQQKIQNRSSEWDLNPENSWSGAGRKPTQESAYRIFVKNPHTGVISEVASLPTQSIKKTSKTNYFESYDCTVDSVNVQSAWQINVWTNEPISKLLKGQKQ